MKKIYLFICFYAVANFTLAQSTITSAGTGTAGTPSVWATGASWVGGVAPTATDNVIIAAGDFVTTGAVTRGAGTTLTVNGWLTITADITMTGTWSVGSTGTFETNKASGNPNIPLNGTFSSTSVVRVSGTLGAATGATGWSQNFGTVIWSPTTQTNTVQLGITGTTTTWQKFLLRNTFYTGTAGGTGGGIVRFTSTAGAAVTVVDSFIVGDGTLRASFQVTGSGITPGNTIGIGTLVVNDGSVWAANASAAVQTINFSNNIVLNGSSGNTAITKGSGVATMNLLGNLELNGTSLLLNGGAGTFTWNFNKAGTALFTKAAGATILTNNNNISFNVNNACTLDLGTSIINSASIASSFIVNGGGGLKIGDPGGIAASGATGNVQTAIRAFTPIVTNYEYTGSAAQVTGTGLPATVNLFTITNASNVSLTNATSVDTLTLTAGKLILGANSIAANVVSGGSSSSYVATDAAGALKINAVGATNVTYPVGPSITSYNPAILNNAGTIDNYSVNVAVGLPVGIDVAPQSDSSVNRIWNISEDVPTGSDVTVTLQWDPAHQGSLFATNNCAVVHSDGTTIDTYGAFAPANPVGPSYTATGTGFTTFSPFGVTSRPTGALPLSLISFNGTLQGSQVKLFWKTENEINVRSYVVEKSTDSRTYNSMATVAALNNVSNNYNATDALVSGVVYYRLKMVERDGSFKYSTIIAINNKKPGVLSIFPNPVNSTIFVSHDKALASAKIEVYAMDGRKVMGATAIVGATQTSINAASLPAGNYSLRFGNGETVQFVKFVKQ